MYKASIIIPYFRKKTFLKKTIKSIINQTYKNFEVIIVYDDENQNELRYVKNIAQSDHRIRLHINKKNLGAGESRNIGIKLAKGKFICFVDADDIWMKNKLKTQINFMNEKKISCSHTSYLIIDSTGKIFGNREAEDCNDYLKLRKSCNIGLSTVIIERSFLKKRFKFPKIKTKEDFVLWLKIVKSGNTIFGLKKNLVKWRKSENSLSSSSIQKIKDGFKVYNQYLEYNIFKSIYFLIILSINFFKKSLLNL
tara:strand:+ start:481 stop:1236 length:756 start_codon:yes stop_codon:yes gene_type:complete